MIGSTAVAPHPTTTGMHARLEAGRTFLAGEEGSGVSAMTRLVRAHPYERLSEELRLTGASVPGRVVPRIRARRVGCDPVHPVLFGGPPRSPAMRG